MTARWAPILVMAALILPATLFPVLGHANEDLVPAAAPEILPAADHASVTDDRVLLAHVDALSDVSTSADRVLYRIGFASEVQGVLLPQDLEARPVLASTSSDTTFEPSAPEPVAEQAPPELVAESAPLVWMATAQGSLAALGAAAQQASGPTLPQFVAPLVFVATAVPAEFGLAPPSAWVAAMFWSVFLTSIGILLVPRVAPAAFWLYARLSQSEMESHPRRALVMAAIRAQPGLHVARIEKTVGIGGGALRHHLEQLEQHGLARRLRHGRATHWYPTGSRLPVHAPATSAQQRVLVLVQQSPDLTTQQVAQRLGTSVQNAWKQLRALLYGDRLMGRRSGRSTHWTLRG